eukprot:10319238-Alexandrium_andersonii.AAC.1
MLVVLDHWRFSCHCSRGTTFPDRPSDPSQPLQMHVPTLLSHAAPRSLDALQRKHDGILDHIACLHMQAAFAQRMLSASAHDLAVCISRDRSLHLSNLASAASYAALASDTKMLYKVQKALRPFQAAPPQ